MGFNMKLALLGAILVISTNTVSVNGACSFQSVMNGRPNSPTSTITSCSGVTTIASLTDCLTCCSNTVSCANGAYRSGSCIIGSTAVQFTGTGNTATPQYDTSSASAGYRYFYLPSSFTGTSDCPARSFTGTPAPTPAPTPTPGPGTTPSPATPAPGACPSWSTTPNTNANNGAGQAGIVDIASCRTACFNNANCLAIDFAPNDPSFRCYIHTDANNVANPNTGQATGVTFEVIDRSGCVAACTGTFTPTANNHILGGTAQSDAATVDQCQQKCLRDTTCNSFDWAPNDPTSKCWLHTGTTTQSMSGITNYRLTAGTRNCPSTTCLGQWTEYTDSNVNGGTGQANINTVDGCKNQCLNVVANCAGFDFAPTNTQFQCWTLTDVSNIRQGQAPGVTHYTLTSRSCAPGATTAQPCVTTYTEYANSNINGGAYDANGDAAVQNCENLCTANLACIGFDYNPAGTQKCWIINTNTGLNQGSAPGVTHYQVNRPAASCITTTGACVDSFQELQNTNSEGGIPQNGVTSVDACKTACSAEPMCVGFDYSPNVAVQCWLHNNINNFNNVATNVANVNQYRISRCDVTTAPTTDPCQPTWQLFENKNADGGVGYAAISTLAECQAKCIEEANCVALDYDASSNVAKCWLHLDASNIATLNDRTGVMHYQLTRTCDDTTTMEATTTSGVCVPQWQISRNMQAEGANPQTSATTAEACQQLCVDTPNCFGLDFDINGATKCWLFDFAITSANLGARTGVDNYILLDRCPGGTTAGCAPQFTLFANSNANGGDPRPSINTLQGCKDLCASEGGCVAFDYDDTPAASAKCWIHTDPTALQRRNTNAFGINMYRIDSRCDDVTTPQTCVGGSLSNTFDMYPNSNAAGGVMRSNAFSLEDCRQYCINDADCIAFDYNRRKEPPANCYLHSTSNEANVNNRGSDPDTDHYRRQTSCATPTPSGPCPNGRYTAYENTNSEGGTPDNALGNNAVLSDCQKKCNDDTRCFAIDYLVTPPSAGTARCWYHYSDQATANGKPSNGVTHYQIVERCGVTPSPPTPTPSTPQPGACTSDILFLLDSSGSMRDRSNTTAEGNVDGWLEAKDYVARVIDDLNVGSSLDRVSVITFSSLAVPRFYFNTYTLGADVEAAILGLNFMGGITNSPDAFDKALNEMFTAQRGDRGSSANNPNADIVVFLTDGEVTAGDPQQMIRDATTLKNRGAVVIGVGISSLIDETQIRSVVTDNSYFLRVPRFVDLKTGHAQLVAAIRRAANLGCGQTGGPGVTPGTTTTPRIPSGKRRR